MNKAEIRTHFLKLRQSLSTEQLRLHGREICDRALDTFDYNQIARVHCYLPILQKKEVDTWPLLKAIWNSYPSIETGIPQVNWKHRTMETIKISNASKLHVSSRGLLEPDAGEVLPPDSLDLLFIPLLSADLLGHRVGYGAGFYDRYLARCSPRAIRCGLGHFAPVEKIADRYVQDQPLDVLIYPGGVVRYSGKSYK